MICHTVCRESNKRRYYIRGIGITTHFGLAGFGTGHPPLGRASWQGTQGLTPTTSTASLAVLARRVLADPHEVGRIEGIGPDLWKSGAALTRASVGREPVTAEDRTCSNPLPARPRPPAAGPRSRPDTSTSCRDYAAGHVDQGQRRPRHRPGYIPAYGVVDDPPPRVLTITRPRRPPLTPLGRGR